MGKKFFLVAILLIFINLFMFSVKIFSSGISCSIILDKPIIGSFNIKSDNFAQNISLNSEVMADFLLPFFAKNFYINNLNTANIDKIYIGNSQIESFDKVSEALTKYRIVEYFKLLLFAFFVSFIQLSLIFIFLSKDDTLLKRIFQNNKLYYFSFGILFCFVLWNFINIYNNAVNIPFADEWEALLPNHLDKNFNLSWLFGYHNEHKVFWTKLSTWIFYNLDGWNIRHQIIFNFFIHLAGMIVLYRIIPDKHNLLPLFFIPCFSTVVIDNQLTGFQNCFYFTALFAFLAIYFGFVQRQNVKSCLLFGMFTVFSMYSLTFAVGIALLIAYYIKERIFNKYTCLASLVIGGGLILFMLGYSSVLTDRNMIFPNNIMYWNKYFYMIFKGILNVSLPVYFLVLSGLILLFSLIYFILKEWKKESINVYIALFGLSLFLVACIASSRSLNQLSADGRHLYIIIYLIPCIAALLYRLKLYKLELIYLIILVLTFYNYFSATPYITTKLLRQQAKIQLNQVLLTNYNCDYSVLAYVNPFDVKKSIERAKNLGVSFIRGR